MKSFILCIVMCIALVGCDPYTPEEVRGINNTTLSSDGEVVGVFKNAQVLRRYKIYNQGTHDHWVYVVDGTVTVNHTVQNGKVSNNKVEVFINGVKQ